MIIEITNEYPESVLPDQNKIIEKIVEASADYEGCPYECRVQVLLTGHERIRDINREFRGIDRTTDVLSFPSSEYPVPGDFSDIEERDPYAFHPETGELILGDIVLCMDKVKEQAAAYGHSLEREIAFLTAHSMLHLMGYDHIEEEDRLLMEQRQEEILDMAGYRRDRGEQHL